MIAYGESLGVKRTGAKWTEGGIWHMSFFYEVVTNNPRLKHIAGCVYLEGCPLDVLAMLRDKVHDGYRLISHPLTGNIPPEKRLYLTVLLASSTSDDDFIDQESLNLIERALEIYERADRNHIDLDPSSIEDMQFLDEQLMMPVFYQYGILSNREVH